MDPWSRRASRNAPSDGSLVGPAWLAGVSRLQQAPRTRRVWACSSGDFAHTATLRSPEAFDLRRARPVVRDLDLRAADGGLGVGLSVAPAEKHRLLHQGPRAPAALPGRSAALADARISELRAPGGTTIRERSGARRRLRVVRDGFRPAARRERSAERPRDEEGANRERMQEGTSVRPRWSHGGSTTALSGSNSGSRVSSVRLFVWPWR